MKLFIQENLSGRTIDFYVDIEKGMRTDSLEYVGSGVIKGTDISNEFPSEGIKPFISLPWGLGNDLIYYIAEYANKKGINTEKESTLKGKFEATKKHLEAISAISDRLLQIIERPKK